MTMRWTIQDDVLMRRLVLSGDITEAADFSFLGALQGAERVAIKLDGVDQINSCGVREWIHFITELSESGVPCDLERCSPAFVRQLNMISNFSGAAAVRSVVAPYYCETCGHQTSRVLELTEGQAPPAIEERVVCPKCGGEAEFDDLPGTYLAFWVSG
ncbi:MAG: hypothetical protein KC933_02825 [Myxococcales bacterium]|nr:hypothetical protein [Myxococcales bacterium]